MKKTVAAPVHPSRRVTPADVQKAKDLKKKGKARTKPETDELLDLLVVRIEALESK